MKKMIFFNLIFLLIAFCVYSQDVNDAKNSFQISAGKGKYTYNLPSPSHFSLTFDYLRKLNTSFETGLTFNIIDYYIANDLLIIEKNTGLSFNYFLINKSKVYLSFGTGLLGFYTKSSMADNFPSCLVSIINNYNFGYQLNSSFGFNLTKNLSLFLNYKVIDKLIDNDIFKLEYGSINYYISDAAKNEINLGLKVRF